MCSVKVAWTLTVAQVHPSNPFLSVFNPQATAAYAQIAETTLNTAPRRRPRAQRAGLVATRLGGTTTRVRRARRALQDTSAAGRTVEYSAAQTTSTVVWEVVFARPARALASRGGVAQPHIRNAARVPRDTLARGHPSRPRAPAENTPGQARHPAQTAGSTTSTVIVQQARAARARPLPTRPV